jgi:hypothetical protein
LKLYHLPPLLLLCKILANSGQTTQNETTILIPLFFLNKTPMLISWSERLPLATTVTEITSAMPENLSTSHFTPFSYSWWVSFLLLFLNLRPNIGIFLCNVLFTKLMLWLAIILLRKNLNQFLFFIHLYSSWD